MVDETDADRRAAADPGGGGGGDAAQLQLGDDGGVERAELALIERRAIAEADDVERHRRQQLEVLVGGDRAAQELRLAAVALDHLGEPLDAVGLQGEPDLEGAEAARELGPVVAEPGIAAGKPALGAGEVVAAMGEGGAVLRRVLDEDAAGVVRHLQPFVKIEGDAIRGSDAAERGAELRRQHGEPAEGGVDMEPQALTVAERRETFEIVDGAAVDGPGRGHGDDGMKAADAVGGDHLREHRQRQAEIGVDRDEAERLATEAQQLEGLGDGAVRLARGIADEPARIGGKPLRPHVDVGERIARDRERDRPLPSRCRW